MNIQFLFPFELIPLHSKIIIYGAGEMGQTYLEQMQITKYCDVVGFVDRNSKEYSEAGFKVYAPEDIADFSYDYIVIAVKAKGALPEIHRVLASVGVNKEKIIYAGSRMKATRPAVVTSHITPVRNDNITIAFFLLSRMGSMIFLKRWIIEIIKYLPDSEIDLYCVNLEEFTKYLFSDIKNVKRVYNNLGSRYQANMENYTMAARLNGGGWIDIEVFKRDNISGKYKEFADKIVLLKEKLSQIEYDVDATPRIVSFERARFLGANAYTALGFGAFDLSDIKVSIPLTEKGKKRYEELGIKKYITVNAGNGSSLDTSKIAKTWPIEYFSKTVKLFKEKYPSIEVVQLGDEDSEKIPSVDRYVFGENFETVSHVLKNAVLHLDIEGGLVHIASQLETKCVVLFGPTPEHYYGYKDNINIKAGNCHDCCGVYLDHNKCAANYTEPKCMREIKPELVMTYINDYMARR